VYQSSVENAAGLGGVVRALFGVWKKENEGNFDDFFKAGGIDAIDVGEGVMPLERQNETKKSDFLILMDSL
jgi:hypothetical protein